MIVRLLKEIEEQEYWHRVDIENKIMELLKKLRGQDE